MRLASSGKLKKKDVLQEVRSAHAVERGARALERNAGNRAAFTLPCGNLRRGPFNMLRSNRERTLVW
ncbi:hypothetical protein ACVJGD_008539 [Bradyrhizobium sp. USDA 10063]